MVILTLQPRWLDTEATLLKAGYHCDWAAGYVPTRDIWNRWYFLGLNSLRLSGYMAGLYLAARRTSRYAVKNAQVNKRRLC